MNRSIVLPFFLALVQIVNAQTDIRMLVKHQSILASKLADASEGFSRKISGDDINYHSTRQDCPVALLVRATDGKMFAEWESAAPELAPGQTEAVFFLITGMSLKGYDINAASPGFTVFINDKPYLHFTNDLGKEWTVNGQSGSRMTFDSFFLDMHGDAFGYSRIFLPVSELSGSEPVRFRITGDQVGSQHWFMVFQCEDGLNWFLNKASSDIWFDLTLRESKGKTEAELKLPSTYSGSKIVGSATNGWKGEWLMLPEGDVSKGKTSLKWTISQLDSVGMTIKTPGTTLIENYPLAGKMESSEIKPDVIAFYRPSRISVNEWKLEGQMIASSISKDLELIASSQLSRGTFHIMASSHQDIAWMDSPEACVEDRDVLLITPALKQLQENPDYYNDMEDILMLREYLGRHPDKKDEIHKLTKQGRLTWGASYIQPYEEMYMGEPLIRQFYLGRKWFRKEFPGCDARIYWNVDVPGRTLQMPQILAKSGVDYMIISRHDKGIFNWVSPDGSKVLTYSPDHYYNSYIHLKKGFFETVTHLAGLTGFWDKYYSPSVPHPVMPVLSDADMALPDSYFDYISTWESISASRPDQEWKLPRLIHSTAEKFMDAISGTGISIPSIAGERPAVWLYIHGPSHYEALKYGRSSGRTLPAAEKLAAFRSTVENNWDTYPAGLLTKAWESGIYPDHGWGGNQGTITDSTFQAKFYTADSIARYVIQSSAEALAAQVNYQPEGIPVTVYNTLSWDRSDPVEVTIPLPEKGFKGIRITDPSGSEVPFQMTGTPVFYPSGAIKEITVVFIANGVPSSGYKTFYVHKGKKQQEVETGAKGQLGIVETEHYRLEFSPGGLASLFDKELNREIWLTDQFLGGELFTMRSVGNGAGEFADIQQPDMEGFDRLLSHSNPSVIKEDGPLRITLTTDAVFKHNKARITWTIYRSIKRLDISVDLIDWDGTAYREFRLAFPVRLTKPEIAYEVPFGVVRVGKDELQHAAGERYVTPCPDVHPRGINNWISASDDDLGVTFSSSVAVWDYVNMTDLPTQATLLQPILLASRQSCHGLGPLYHQTGSHSMSFSLFTHAPGWQNGYKNALQANEPLVVVVDPEKKAAKLPDSWSFISVDDPNTIISAIKKEEFGDGLVIRIYDTEGKDKEVNLKPNFSFLKVLKTDMLEENGKETSHSKEGIHLTIGHNAIETLIIVR